MESAFGAAFFFAWSITCARRSSFHHGADLANLARITIAFLAIGTVILGTHQPLLVPGWPWLLLGGAIGLGVGDIASFHSLTRIGAGLALLVMQTLAAPFALLLEYLVLGHAPRPRRWPRPPSSSSASRQPSALARLATRVTGGLGSPSQSSRL